jgi:hypothetical protein
VLYPAVMRIDAPANPFNMLFPPPRPRAFYVGFGAATHYGQHQGNPPFLGTTHGSIDGALWRIKAV